jgi:hypothetical protein
VSEQEGWVQNLNQASLQGRLSDYQQGILTSIESQRPGSSITDVVGSRAIQPVTVPVLPASLPYQLVATGNRYSNLPSTLRHEFQYSLYANAYERSIENPSWTFHDSTPNLAGKKLTLTFVPASEADRQTIQSYLPSAPSDGSPIQAEEFPSSIPAYNIRVTAELRLDGSVVAQGGTFALGTELLGEGGFTRPHNLSDWDLTQEKHVAGQTSALGLSLQGISDRQLQDVKDTLTRTHSALLANGLAGLTPEQLSGDLLVATVWTYFRAVESFGALAQRQALVIDSPALTYGFFHAQVVPEYRYGVVNRAHFTGTLMDVGHQRRIAVHTGDDRGAWLEYNRVRGTHSSAMEHAIPEILFSYEAHTSSSVSAVKALDIAAATGQKIYLVTNQNAAAVVPALTVDETVKSEIRIATAAGKQVTVSAGSVNVGKWTGIGYIILDPETGAGSYLVSGGFHGAPGDLCGAILLGLGILLVTAVIVALIPVIAGAIPVGAGIAAVIFQAVAGALRGLAVPVIQRLVAATVGVLVAAEAGAAQIIGVCFLIPEATTTSTCYYECPNGELKDKPRPQQCGFPQACPPRLVLRAFQP